MHKSEMFSHNPIIPSCILSAQTGTQHKSIVINHSTVIIPTPFHKVYVSLRIPLIIYIELINAPKPTTIPKI